MSVQKIPTSEKKVIQSNIGDYQGNVWATFNIDLDSNPGTIKVSRRLSRILDADQWDGTAVQALQVHDGNYYMTNTADVWVCSVNSDPTDVSNWTEITTLGLEDLGLESDSTSYNGLILFSLGTDIMSWNGSSKDDDWWTTIASGTALTANKVHTLEVLRTGADTLFITDGNKVRYYNGAAGGTTITLDSLMTANLLIPGLDKMWCGTYTEIEDNAYVYEIQVGETQVSQAYPVDGRACLSGFFYKNVPFIITERGYIQFFNGAGFETIAQFPWATESKMMEGCRPGLIQDSPTALAIHPKGCKVSGKYAYIYVNTDDEFLTDTNLSSRAPSGVWVLDLETYSLTHRYSLTTDTDAYGSHKVDRSGPILITNTPYTKIMVGGSTDAIEGLWMETDTTPQGYFITTRHESETVTDAFEFFVVKADTPDTGESIEVKYRNTVVPNMPYEVKDVTWLTSTQFTTSDALTGVQPGYEVEVLSGYRAGHLAHVVSVTGDTTKTVTIDESIGLLNETSDVSFDYFNLISDQMTDGEYKRIGASESGTFRQYKVVMTGDVTVRETISKSNSKHEL